MTDEDRTKIQRLNEIEKIQQDLFNEFNQVYPMIQIEDCHNLLKKFVVLLIEKNFD